MHHQLIIATLFLQGAWAQTWCGKHYKASLPPTPPGGLFASPASSSSPLLALRCSPVIQPYLPEDNTNAASSDVAVLVDAPVTYSKIANAAPVTLSNTLAPLSVKISIGGQQIAQGTIALNSTTTIPISLQSLTPRAQPYNITCTAVLSGQTYTATGSLSYLPSPPPSIGSVTKVDLRTGALLAKPANGKSGPYAPVYPIGFYTSFDDYLAQDLTIPAKLAAQGFTIIHPVPTFTNLTQLDLVLDKMQDAGLYLMYDMRWTYMNSTSVTEQVNRIKSRPNLLLWYTADEPDGTSDPLDATVNTYNLITSLDGGDGKGGIGYHPVSLVLNCQNYYFTEYSRGGDILMQDAYMIGNNVTWSTVWGTACNENYGDCGCDNCIGSFEDISTRMDEFKERLFINGWDRTKSIWTVPQGFGNETYWKRYPTGAEFVVESVVGINHGALGVVSWDDPTTADIKASASTLALGLQKMNRFILNPSATFRQITINRVDVGIWKLGSETLVLGTNMNYSPVTISVSSLGLSGLPSSTQVMDSGSVYDPARGHLIFQSVGSGGFVFVA